MDRKPAAIAVVATAVISWLGVGEALDNHWTTAWMLMAGLAVVWAAARWIELEKPVLWGVGLLVFFLLALAGGEARWEVLAMGTWLWTWAWTRPREDSMVARALAGLPWFALIVGGVMLGYAGVRMATGDWTHGATYELIFPWAHRNFAIESMFAMVLIGGLKSKRLWWAWWGFVSILAFTYQVRGVLLGSGMWLLYELFVSKRGAAWMRWTFVVGSLAMASVQILWNLLPVETRVEQFAKFPDPLKSLDVMYNLRSAESSSVRVQLWDWTAEHITLTGAGLGAWRQDAEGWVNLRNQRCGEATRRAHSDFLQWLFELGILPFLILLAIGWPLRRSLGRWAWLTLPFLLFTFPMERAETMWAFAALGWFLKLQHPSGHPPAHWGLPAGVFALSALLLGSWGIAQNALGRVAQQTGSIRTDWGPVEEACLALHPLDIALNHADLLRVMSDFNAGKTEAAVERLKRFHEKHPRSISGIRIWLKAQGKPSTPDDICVYLQQLLSQQNSTAGVL